MNNFPRSGRSLRNFGVLAIIVVTPPVAIILWYTDQHLHGSVGELFRFFRDHGFFGGLWKMWGPVIWGSSTAWSILGIFAATELVLMKILPGKKVQGPVTPKGYTPVYRNNGFAAFLVSLFLFWLLGFQMKLFRPAMIYDHFGEILGALNIFSLSFTFLLYVKGLCCPTTPDSGTTGSFLFDYYWGTDLYPHILGINVKHFANCRFGMMSWPLLILAFAAKQHEMYGTVSDSMIVSVFLQLVYVGIFFYYESGYFRTMDIQVDRAGYYLIWGVMVWVPSVYTLTAHWLVNHPTHLGPVLSVLFVGVGLLSFWSKTSMNRQRIRVREHDGNYKIWGHPARIIRARYTDDKGEERESILLVDGWWRIARHFHYVGEILGALCWSLPALAGGIIPYFYVFYLTLLLVHRAHRDDKRCRLKYGEYWEEYTRQVPYKILPGVF